MTLLGKLVEGAKVFGSGSYIQDGAYVFAVERTFEQRGYEGEAFIAELRVLKSEPLDDKIKPNPVGSTCSVVYNVTKQGDSAKGNIKAILMAILGLSEAELTAEVYDAAVSEEQPLRGMLLGCRTFKKTNQGRKNAANRGMLMTLPKWETIPDQTEEAIAATRAELDAKVIADKKAAEAPAAAAPAGGKKLAGILGKKG